MQNDNPLRKRKLEKVLHGKTMCPVYNAYVLNNGVIDQAMGNICKTAFLMTSINFRIDVDINGNRYL